MVPSLPEVSFSPLPQIAKSLHPILDEEVLVFVTEIWHGSSILNLQVSFDSDLQVSSMELLFFPEFVSRIKENHCGAFDDLIFKIHI